MDLCALSLGQTEEVMSSRDKQSSGGLQRQVTSRTRELSGRAVDRFVTITAVANLLGVCERTVRRWIDRKELSKHGFGSITRIGEGDLQIFVDRARRGPAAPHTVRALDDEFYTAQQVAELLDVCLRTVRRLIDDELLVAHDFCGVIRIARADLQSFFSRSRDD